MNSTLIQRKTRERVLIEKNNLEVMHIINIPFWSVHSVQHSSTGIAPSLEQPEETLSKWTNQTAAGRGSPTFPPTLYDALHSPSHAV